MSYVGDKRSLHSKKNPGRQLLARDLPLYETDSFA
jgi:hypothetical protein